MWRLHRVTVVLLFFGGCVFRHLARFEDSAGHILGSIEHGLNNSGAPQEFKQGLNIGIISIWLRSLLASVFGSVRYWLCPTALDTAQDRALQKTAPQKQWSAPTVVIVTLKGR